LESGSARWLDRFHFLQSPANFSSFRTDRCNRLFTARRPIQYYRSVRRAPGAAGPRWRPPGPVANLSRYTLHRQTFAMSDKDNNKTPDGDTGTIVRAKPKTKKPSMYKVIMLNDDYTPMEFVVHVLERFFAKTREEATQIMLHVHQRGVGICGVYTYEVAESKVNQTMDLARRHQHPLQCTLEKE
jgi:ATP-dependent Clp protease adaptor protein ClpS